MCQRPSTGMPAAASLRFRAGMSEVSRMASLASISPRRTSSTSRVFIGTGTKAEVLAKNAKSAQNR